MMLHADVNRLALLGLRAAQLQQAEHCLHTETAAAADFAGVTGWHLMRVAAVHRNRLQLDDGLALQTAQAVPRLAAQQADPCRALTVGDWVLAEAVATGPWRVQARLPPSQQLLRRDADGTRHPVASHVDQALLVMGLDADFNLRRLERFVALVQGRGITPWVVLTKADLLPDVRSLYARVAAVRARLPEPVPVLSVDARDSDTAQRLAALAAPGHTLVLLGSSGAGKSTLANTWLGRDAQRVGEVRQRDGRGEHTTTTRSLLRLPGGACLIDTPGLRALRPDADAQTVAHSFSDIARLAPACRFRNCQHQGEPGCAVRATVDDDRLMNFHKLIGEARSDALGARGRQARRAVWRLRSRARRAGPPAGD